MLLLVGLSLPAQATCVADRVDQSATVAFIADGDTVRLDNGEWVRFIGINTPEKGGRRRAAEPLADVARVYLQEMLRRDGMQISLRHGSERRDRHGRLLAHAFLPDGTNISEKLIDAGLGFHVAVPPNLWALDCYQGAEQRARREQKGIWKQTWYAAKDSRTLAKNARGFMRVRGKVVRIGKSRKASWINLEGRVALRLANKDRQAFSNLDINSLVGKTITVRGWFYPSKSKHDDLRTNLRHPAALELN